jgi:DNA polymerase-3 subunit epsilon
MTERSRFVIKVDLGVMVGEVPSLDLRCGDPMSLLAVVDVETTGFNPWRSDRVIELAAVVLDELGNTVREFNTLVNPDRDLGPVDVHGIEAGEIRHAPRFSEILGNWLDFLNGVGALAGHNMPFDRSFLQTEFNRVEMEFPPVAEFCTLRLSGGGALAACCADYDVPPPTTAHSAMEDARATARLVRALLADSTHLGQQIFQRPPLIWPSYPAARVELVTRTVARLARQQPPTFLKKLVQRASLVPAPDSDDGAEIAYTATLDRALEDRFLTDKEGDELVDLALHWGLTVPTVHRLHETYLRHLVAVALADATVTPTEQRDLQQVARLLGIGESRLSEILSLARSRLAARSPAVTIAESTSGKPSDWYGKRVCFTGQLRSRHEGAAITRELAEELARRAGLEPVDAVTKKLDMLVVGDPETLSGKAKKAHQYGVRVLHEPVFWKLLGVEVE